MLKYNNFEILIKKFQLIIFCEYGYSTYGLPLLIINLLIYNKYLAIVSYFIGNLHISLDLSAI